MAEWDCAEGLQICYSATKTGRPWTKWVGSDFMLAKCGCGEWIGRWKGLWGEGSWVYVWQQKWPDGPVPG